MTLNKPQGLPVTGMAGKRDAVKGILMCLRADNIEEKGCCL